MYLFPILLLFFIAPLLAQQDAASPAPSPSPEVAMTPATDATPVPAAGAPAPDAAPAPEAKPSPATTGEDVIPLPPESGPTETPIVSESEVPGLSKPPGNEPLSDAAFADPNAVIPNDAGMNLPPIPAGPSAQEVARKVKVRYQEVRTTVEKDADVRSLMEQAKSAKTFEDERAALREYYRLLFKKMKKVDKDLTEKCDLMLVAYLNRLAQTRLEPTIPLNPPPTPTPLSE